PTTAETITCSGWNRVALNSGVAPINVRVRSVLPQHDGPCEDLHYYRVVFTMVANGIEADFSFAGGAATGSLLLPPDKSNAVSNNAVYVADVQLGDYEPMEPSSSRWRQVCRLDRTYHFYCPETGQLDALCLTWVRGVPP